MVIANETSSLDTLKFVSW